MLIILDKFVCLQNFKKSTSILWGKPNVWYLELLENIPFLPKFVMAVSKRVINLPVYVWYQFFAYDRQQWKFSKTSYLTMFLSMRIRFSHSALSRFIYARNVWKLVILEIPKKIGLNIHAIAKYAIPEMFYFYRGDLSAQHIYTSLFCSACLITYYAWHPLYLYPWGRF